jgi:hypothetical protein
VLGDTSGSDTVVAETDTAGPDSAESERNADDRIALSSASAIEPRRAGASSWRSDSDAADSRRLRPLSLPISDARGCSNAPDDATLDADIWRGSDAWASSSFASGLAVNDGARRVERMRLRNCGSPTNARISACASKSVSKKNERVREGTDQERNKTAEIVRERILAADTGALITKQY